MSDTDKKPDPREVCEICGHLKTDEACLHFDKPKPVCATCGGSKKVFIDHCGSSNPCPSCQPATAPGAVIESFEQWWNDNSTNECDVLIKKAANYIWTAGQVAQHAEDMQSYTHKANLNTVKLELGESKAELERYRTALAKLKTWNDNGIVDGSLTKTLEALASIVFELLALSGGKVGDK